MQEEAPISYEPKRPWKRVLYEKQQYRDNYVDPVTFLDRLNMNLRQERPSLGVIFIGATLVVQQFSVVSIFLTTYKYIRLNSAICRVVLQFDVCTLIIGYCLHKVVGENTSPLSHTISQCALFGVCLRIVAPVLQNLTAAFSSDTIHALAITFSTIHLVFHDYAYVNYQHDTFSGTISLNAAMFTSIILASRLHSMETVLALLLLAVLSFILFPSTARLVKHKSHQMHLVLVVLLWAVASVMLFFLDTTLFVAYEALVLILWVMGPFLFYTMHQYKRSMRGPWDTAEVH